MDDGKPKLLVQVREQIRVRNYSIRTESVYAEWVKHSRCVSGEQPV